MNSSSALIFIDGAYLSKISKYFGKGKYLKIDIALFTTRLVERHGFECRHIFYYNAPPFESRLITQKEAQMKAGYESFISKLKNNPNVTVREGRVQKIGGIFAQKGVDTLITMDLCSEPHSRKIRTIFLITSDTDFVPVLKELREKYGMIVYLCYFMDRVRGSPFSMSNHLLTVCDKKILLSEDDFTKNLRKKE